MTRVQIDERAAIDDEEAKRRWGYFGFEAPLPVHKIEDFDLGMTEDDCVRAIWNRTLACSEIGNKLFVTPGDIQRYLSHQDVGTIYVVGFHRYVKIGYSRGLEGRLKALQGGLPIKLTVLRTMVGHYSEERRFHRRFHDQRLEGEWFFHGPEIRKWLRERVTVRTKIPEVGYPFSARGQS